MPDSINWIDLTDLHYGLDEQSWLWPRNKHDFFRDVAKVSEQVDGWDLVFFTGDFVQSGATHEFDKLNKELDDIWKVLSKNGRVPKLCPVPGNHDLYRPDAGSAVTKSLTQLWISDGQMRKHFWKDPNCEYRNSVTKYFEAYTGWLDKLTVPLIGKPNGILPGDFAATFQKGSLTLGIVGLNSTFLQIIGGDRKGCLDLHVSQLNAVCGGDPESWLQEHLANVLLTHQPPSWLTPEAISHFRQEIYPPGRFLAHLCGHQHEPEAFELSEAGSAPRRTRQGPSIFGLESWQDVEPRIRIHGYNAGQFVFESNSGYEKLWPRITIRARHGGLNLCPDHTYTLREGDFVITPFELPERDNNDSTQDEDKSIEPATTSVSEPALLENAPNEETAKKDLSYCPTLPETVGAQHCYVRQEEQSECENALRKTRCVWIVSDWGAGAEGFLVTIVERFRGDGPRPPAFHLKCDDATSVNELELLFPQQFGMPFQRFCHLAASLDSAFLILEGIHSNLRSGDQLLSLSRITSAVLDYCPKLKLILTSQYSPAHNRFSLLALHALDAPDVRTYIRYHQESSDITDADTIEKLHERSEGLPMHLDRMLKALRVTSITSVLEAELERSPLSDPDTPRGLVHALTQLTGSEDRRSKRSLRLLKVLSVLTYGETLESVSHYLPAETFYLENALQLSDLALLDVVPMQQTGLQKSIGGSLTEHKAPKLLKVPRQVRDHVLALLPEDERVEIVKAGLEHFFGRQWRQGKAKLRRRPPEYQEFIGSGAGNEFALIHHLVAHARDRGDSVNVKRGIDLGIIYAARLRGADRFRDLTVVSEALLQLIDRTKQPEEWARFAALFGAGLRMIDKNDECLVILRDALEIGECDLSPREKAGIWLDIALAEEEERNLDEAISAAKEVQVQSREGDGRYMNAELIIVSAQFEGQEKIVRLTKLESQARNAGYLSLANTISLALADEYSPIDAKLKQINKVLQAKSRGYNQVRAIIEKAKAVSEDNPPGILRDLDLAALSAAYSYLHSQRLSSLFDQCHEHLWAAFEANGDLPRLLRLFRP